MNSYNWRPSRQALGAISDIAQRLELAMEQGLRAHKVVRFQGSYLLHKLCSQMAVGLQPYALTAI